MQQVLRVVKLDGTDGYAAEPCDFSGRVSGHGFSAPWKTAYNMTLRHKQPVTQGDFLKNSESLPAAAQR